MGTYLSGSVNIDAICSTNSDFAISLASYYMNLMPSDPNSMPSIVLNHISYPITVIRRKGTRRFVIRFDAKNQQVKLTLPPRGNLEQGLKFTHSKKTWLELQQEKLGAHITLKPGMVVSILGDDIQLKHEEGRGLATYIPSPIGRGLGLGCNMIPSVNAPLPTSHLQGEGNNAILIIHGDEAFFSRRLKDWLTKHLREIISEQASVAAREIGVTFTRIQIRDVAHQWGSCSAHGTLSFAFHLVFASKEQLHYIICHEVAHLKEMNHGPRFWKLVEQLCPDYAKHRKWLKTHGHALHRICM